MSKEPVAIVLKGILPATNGFALFLGNETKTFVIYVDHFVAKAIEMAISGEKKERPLTHDLIGSILLGLGARLDHIIINDVINNEAGDGGTYFARIFLRMENELGRKIVEIDARPSDSLVLALQQKRPIYVARSVFDRVPDETETLERILRRQAEEGGEVEGGEGV